MFWGMQQITDFQAQVNPGTILERNYKNILAMNEPNQQGQAQVSAGDAAAQWKQYLEPLKANTGVRLGSPAPTNAPSGKQWLYDFLGACGGGCNVDFIALRESDLSHAILRSGRRRTVTDPPLSMQTITASMPRTLSITL